MALSIVNFNTIDLSGIRVDHLVAAALKVTLSEDDFSFELLAVVAEAQILSLMPILHLHTLQLAQLKL